MLKKIIKQAVSTAKKSTEEIKKNIEEQGLLSRTSELLGDTPVPFSGLTKSRETTSKKTEQTVQQPELPHASRRAPALEDRILSVAQKLNELSSYTFEKCILPESTYRVVEKNGLVTTRILRVFMAGKDAKGRGVVKDLCLSQLANQPLKNHTSDMLEDDALFDQHAMTFHSMEKVTYLISEDALQDEIKLKSRNILSPVLVYNTLAQSIKVQSTNLQTDGYQSLTIPGFGRKNFMYHSEHGSGIRISYSNSGKLIKHIPVDQIPMDAINVP